MDGLQKAEYIRPFANENFVAIAIFRQSGADHLPSAGTYIAEACLEFQELALRSSDHEAASAPVPSAAN